MQFTELEKTNLLWRKARHSSGNGACIEVASCGGGIVVRDSKDPIGPVLLYSASAWRSFLPNANTKIIQVFAGNADAVDGPKSLQLSRFPFNSNRG